jgi:hypothetical protein
MKKFIELALVAVLIVVGFLVFGMNKPRRVAANVIFNEVGEYVSPAGDSSSVEVFENDKGKLEFILYHQMKEGRSRQGPTKAFKPDSNWFMCWDSQGRLWTYLTEENFEYCRNWYRTGEASGTIMVGEFGGWEGIPEAFFERLPKVAKDKYELYKQKKDTAHRVI